MYAYSDPATYTDPSGNVSISQVTVATTITSILVNSAITGYAMGRAGYTSHKNGSGMPDGVIISYRPVSYGVNARAVGVGISGGFDAVYSGSKNKLIIYAAGDVSISPFATFKSGKGLSFKGNWSIGPVWNMGDPSSFRGFGASASWPSSSVRLLCNAGGIARGPMWGYACQSRKLAKSGTGLTLSFGFSGLSADSPAFLKVSRGASISSDFLGWAEPVSSGPIVDFVKPIAREISGYSNADGLIEKIKSLAR